jgi:hypothetical protein
MVNVFDNIGKSLTTKTQETKNILRHRTYVFAFTPAFIANVTISFSVYTDFDL